MLFVRTFKGYEDRTQELDHQINEWIVANKVDVVDLKPALSHEPESRARSGDLIYALIYRANQPIAS